MTEPSTSPPRADQYVATEEFLRAWTRFSNGREILPPTAMSLNQRIWKYFEEGIHLYSSGGERHAECVQTASNRDVRPERYTADSFRDGTAEPHLKQAVGRYATDRMCADYLPSISAEIGALTRRLTRFGGIHLFLNSYTHRFSGYNQVAPEQWARYIIHMRFSYIPYGCRLPRYINISGGRITRICRWAGESPGGVVGGLAWLCCVLCHTPNQASRLSSASDSTVGRTDIMEWVATAGSDLAVGRVPTVRPLSDYFPS